MNNFIGKMLSAIVRLYQLSIGTVFGGQCRYHPSCSEYARQALAKHGAIKGLGKSIWRILRCNPLSHGGFDPV